MNIFKNYVNWMKVQHVSAFVFYLNSIHSFTPLLLIVIVKDKPLNEDHHQTSQQMKINRINIL
jgi:hypothetical protein